MGQDITTREISLLIPDIRTLLNDPYKEKYPDDGQILVYTVAVLNNFSMLFRKYENYDGAIQSVDFWGDNRYITVTDEDVDTMYTVEEFGLYGSSGSNSYVSPLKNPTLGIAKVDIEGYGRLDEIAYGSRYIITKPAFYQFYMNIGEDGTTTTSRSTRKIGFCNVPKDSVASVWVWINYMPNTVGFFLPYYCWSPLTLEVASMFDKSLRDAAIQAKNAMIETIIEGGYNPPRTLEGVYDSFRGYRYFNS